MNHLGFCVTSFGLVSREALQRSDFVYVCQNDMGVSSLSSPSVSFSKMKIEKRRFRFFFFVTTERKKSKDGGESVTRKKGEEGGGKV